MLHQNRAGLFLTARLLLCAAMSIIVATQVTGFAPDDPPPEEVPVTESTDLDGDNQSDAITAAPAGEDAEEPDPGEVYMSSSEGGDVTIRGGEDDDWFGAAVADVGDLNNDGFRDLLVGAPRENNGEGRAYVFYGPFRDYENPDLDVADADMTFRSPDASDFNFGLSVRAIADIDCDGRPDIGIGALNDDGQGNEISIAYIASGANGGPVYRIVGENPFDTWHELDGDADGDGDVDQADMAIVGSNIGRTGPTLTRRDGDFDGDFDVDATDYAQVMANFGADHFTSIRGCNPGCPPPANIPPGFHCIERCSADSIVAPINVWSECDPIMCPADCSCTFQIFPAPPVWQPAYEVPRETEVIVMVDPHSNGAAVWQILEGAERIQLLETTPTYLRFNTLTFGPVHITATYDCCMGWCPLDIPLFITCDSMPEPWLDTDYDQIIDGVECEMGLNPNFSDSDGDSMPDNWEIQNGFDPLDPSDGAQDNDGDGVPNFLEYLYGSDPFNAASGADPAMDADGDGYIDWLEEVRGSDKFDPNSVPEVDFTSGEMAWAVINGVHDDLNSEIIEMCVGDWFRLHATAYADSWFVMQGQNLLVQESPFVPGSCYSNRWRIAAPGDIIVASARGYGAHTTLGHLHIRAMPANQCDDSCPITIAPCGGGLLPEFACVGQEVCLVASGADGESGDYQWTVLENAAFVSGSTGSQVTIEITDPGEVLVSVMRGECGGGIDMGAELEFTDYRGLYEGRVYTNREYDPAHPGDKTKAIWTKDKQYVDITVNVGGDVDAGAVVSWEKVDPDDPSNDAPMTAEAGRILDPNDYNAEGVFNEATGDDNTGTRDAPADWAQIENYTLAANTTAIIDRISKVRFHVTDDGGDNFKVKARVVVNGQAMCEPVESELMTVWHLIELENVKMQSAGPLPLDSLNERFSRAFLEWEIDATRLVDDTDPMGSTLQQADQNALTYSSAGGQFAHDPDSGWFFVASAVRHIALSGTSSPPLVNFNDQPNASVVGGPNPLNQNYQGAHAGILFFPQPIPPGDIAFVEITKPGDVTKSIYFEAALTVPEPGMPQDRKNLDLKARVRQPVNNPNTIEHLTLPDHGFPDDGTLWLKVRVWGLGGLSVAGHTPSTGPVGNEEFTGKTIVYARDSFGNAFPSIEDTFIHEMTHTLGAAHKCLNRDFTTSGKSCVMMYFDDWLALADGTLSPWTGGNVGLDLCAKHIEFIRKTNLEDDNDNAPGRILQWN